MSRPSQTDPDNFLVNTIFENNFLELANKYISGKMIDLGCGVKPYEEMLSHLVAQHIGVDHELTVHDKANIDLFGTAYSIPTEDNVFDSAICTAVLEHLEEPEMAIRECFRVLKKGGHAIYSVPFIWQLHEQPRDFYRYSKYGLQYLFEKVGFEVVDIRPLSGFAVTFIQLHLYIIKGKFEKGIIKKIGIIKLYSYLMQRFGLFLNKRDNTKEWTWMYTITVKK
jgi:ubiquinone/menaquinone biosynthesis C-methylase UbiE